MKEQHTMLSFSFSFSSSSSIIIFIIFFFSVRHTTSLPSHADLSSCHNTTFNCGNITNLSYPFTGGNRPSFCGLPQFLLRCHNGIPMLNISSVSYRVLQLNSSTSSLILARQDLWNETCTQSYVNSSFDGTKSFSYGSENRNLLLFYECKPTPALNTTLENLFHCERYGDKNNSYSVVGPSVVSLEIRYDPSFSLVKCDVSVGVPILVEEANRLVKNRSLLREVLMKGFHVNYSDPFENDCDECRSSGGQCGFDSEENVPICICGNGFCPSPGSKWNRRPILIGASIAGFGVLILCIIMVSYQLKKGTKGKKMFFWKRRNSANHNVKLFMQSDHFSAPKRYNYSELKRITNSFRNKLGQGGYGVVYKASLPNGCDVAVKVIGESKGNGEEFINEVASISRTSHVNIVSLLGFCYEGNKRALIYELMPNGSLDKFIYKSGFSHPICDFDWNTMFRIVIGIAQGLEYLHQGCSSRILHLDIKPQNILLDEDFCPKISDFGLAKICQKKESIVSMLGARGTIGYMAPEIFSRAFGGVSHKSDVYSYGMLIIEIIGGRKNHDTGGSYTTELYFPEWIYKDLEQGNTPVSSLAISEEENDMVKKITMVSLWCIQTNPSNRPSMKNIIEMLEGPLLSIPYPPKPVLCSPERPILHISSMSSNHLYETNSITSEINDSTKSNEFNEDQTQMCL